MMMWPNKFANTQPDFNMNDEPKKENVSFAQQLGNLWPWKQEVIEEGSETWTRPLDMIPGYYYTKLPMHEFNRQFVKYKITNKFTGNVAIRKEYLN